MVRDLASFQTKKNLLIDLVDAVHNALEEANAVLCDGLDGQFRNNPIETYQNNLEAQKKRLIEERFKILVLGEFSSGKSTFLNAILKQKVIPVAVRPTTATINIVKYAESPKAVVHFINTSLGESNTSEISIDELKHYTTSLDEESDRLSQSIELVEIYFPSDYCKNSVEILDTPGLASTKAHHERVTLDYIPNGNACIFLLNPTQPLSKSERHYLRLVRNYIRKVFFVSNKMDLVEEDEKEEVLSYLKDELAKELNCTTGIDVYPISADWACRGKLTESGFTTFISQLETFLLSDLMLNEYYYPTARMLSDIVQNLIDAVNMRITGLEFSPDVFEEKISNLRPKLDQARKTLNDIIDYINVRKDVIKNKVALSAANSYAQLNNRIESVITGWGGEIGNLREDLPKIIKENLMNTNYNINSFLQNELDHLNEEINQKYSYFLDDIDSIKSELLIHPEGTADLVPQFHFSTEVPKAYVPSKGMSASIGFIIGYLGGPVAVVIAWLGSVLFSKLSEEQIRQKTLLNICNQVTSKLDEYRRDSISQFNIRIVKQISDFTEHLDKQMSVLIQEINDSISSVAKERNKAEKEVTDRKEIYKNELSKLKGLSSNINEFLEKMV